MKRKRKDLLGNILALALLAGAIGIIGWQGMALVTEEQTAQTAQRIVIATTQETPATESAAQEEAQTSAAQQTATKAHTEMATTGRAISGDDTSEAQPAQAEAAEQVVFPLDLNGATTQELEALPEIGAVLAERIVAYRERIGGYLYREQLLEVSGIGDATLAAIYDLVYIAGEQYPLDNASQIQQADPPVIDDVQAETTPPPESAPVVQATQAPTAPTQPIAPTEPVAVDLNTATKEELMQVPHMTEVLAEEILEFRDTYAYFSSPYELLYLEHMSGADFPEMEPYLLVEPSQASE